MNLEILRRYISEYEKEFSQIHDKEKYKWRAVKQFQDNWNPDADNFAKMLSASLSKTRNLLAAANYWPREMIARIATKRPQLVREMFINLFDEEIDLLERINFFQKESKDLNARLLEDKNDYQDHRAVLVYLSLKFPEIYFFYKFEMFKVFCEKVDYEYQPKKGSKSNIIQFLELCKTIREELRTNNKLLKLHTDRLGEAEYFDREFNILTQDFIYAVTRHLELRQETLSAIKPRLTLKTMVLEVAIKHYQFKGKYIDHVAQHKRNKQLGDLGEQFVLQYEKDHCLPEFAHKIINSAKSQGDGLGFDILSYDHNGVEKYIEVKTTKGNLNKSFYISGTELERSKKEGDRYFLYRLYNFDQKNMTAECLILQGDLSKYCINSTEYEVTFRV